MPANSPQSSASAIPSAGWLSHWRWWWGELKAALPTSMSRLLDGDATATIVTVDESGVTIITTDVGATESTWSRRVLTDALASSPVLQELIAAGRDRVRLVLTPDQAFVKTITLPLATEENLREVVGFELDRHTPFTPDQAYYDVQIVRRDQQTEKITILLVVASKTEVVALVDLLRKAGLTCTSIGISHAAEGDVASLDLQPAYDKPPRRLSRIHRINLGLFGLAAALAIVATILPIWQKREAVRVLIPQAEKAGTEFQVSERIFSEYVKLAAEYNFLLAKKHGVYPALSVIEELAQVFPETTWVRKLDIKATGKAREVILLGEAQSASKVIENLEQSPSSLFQNSKQQSQTTRTQQPNVEQFHVSAEIKPRPVPAAESIDVVVTTAPSGSTPATPMPVPIPSTLAPVTAPGIPATGSMTPPMTSLTPMQPATAAAPDMAVVKRVIATPAPIATPAVPSTTTVPPSLPPNAPPGKRNGS